MKPLFSFPDPPHLNTSFKACIHWDGHKYGIERGSFSKVGMSDNPRANTNYF